MLDISTYGNNIVSISKSALIEIFALLKEYRENLVLVGGWVPYFLLNRYKPKKVEFKHIGSIDIDIAIDRKGMPAIEEVYESIRQRLEKNDYHIRKSINNQPIPYSFEKEIDGIVIHVDFLASEYGGTGKRHRHQPIQDILARKAKGLDIAFQDNEIFKIEGLLPNQAKYCIKVKVAGALASVTTKAIAFDNDISRIKDAYDIYSILKYYKQGVASVVGDIKQYSHHKLVKEAMEKLSALFSTLDSVGAIGLADFLLPEDRDSLDWEFYQRDGFEIVQQFLQEIK